ncbi:MAG: sulfotransferase [Pseudomonadota bacterium]
MPKIPVPPQRPSFLCIGTAKAGTSWFHQMFGQHPDVWMSLLKETHYYDGRFGQDVKVPKNAIRRRTLARAEKAARNSGPLSANAVYWEALTRGIWSPDWYAKAFTHPDAMGRLCGEATPAYCALPDEGIRAIWDELPGVRLIHFIRDPVGRALSGIRMAADLRGFSPDEPPDPEWWAERAQASAILARGDYAAHIPRWQAVFPAERILYVPFGELKTDPLGVLRRIEKHLDLPTARYDISRIAKPVNVGKRYQVPPGVADALEERLAPQWAFLMDHFPQEFCKRLS